MPALEELTPQSVSWPLPSEHTRADISRQPTLPLARQWRLPTTRRLPLAGAATPADPRATPTRVPRQRRRRRPRCLTLFLLLLLTLVVLGGLLISGLYTLETTVLAPLAQFFHPVSGDTAGTIEGRAWNLLLLGSDNDQKFVFPAMLTQVMMVVRVDPAGRRVFMLSIPRDSWVAVPGQAGRHKVDQAFDIGAAVHRSFDDGVRLARATIEQDYGIAIDRYAWVGLAGFASVVNTVGGIDIDVTHPLLDDNYPDDTGETHISNPYALRRLFLVPGPQHLTGEQALEYVRSRHADLVGDIGRTWRQQEILTALKKKLNSSMIFHHLSDFFHDLAGKVYTDLSEQEMLSVASFARALPAGSLQHLTLGPGQGDKNYGTLATIKDPGPDDGQAVILPDCTNIEPIINQMFDLGDVHSCQADGGG
jgi:LCP family protein required for cell wall assembly